MQKMKHKNNQTNEKNYSNVEETIQNNNLEKLKTLLFNYTSLEEMHKIFDVAIKYALKFEKQDILNYLLFNELVLKSLGRKNIFGMTDKIIEFAKKNKQIDTLKRVFFKHILRFNEKFVFNGKELTPKQLEIFEVQKETLLNSLCAKNLNIRKGSAILNDALKEAVTYDEFIMLNHLISVMQKRHEDMQEWRESAEWTQSDIRRIKEHRFLTTSNDRDDVTAIDAISDEKYTSVQKAKYIPGEKALFYAIELNKPEAIDYLLKNKLASIYAFNEQNLSCLPVAVESVCPDCIKVLLIHGAAVLWDVNSEDYYLSASQEVILEKLETFPSDLKGIPFPITNAIGKLKEAANKYEHLALEYKHYAYGPAQTFKNAANSFRDVIMEMPSEMQIPETLRQAISTIILTIESMNLVLNARNQDFINTLRNERMSASKQLEEKLVVPTEKSPEPTEQGKWHEEKRATEKEVVIEDNTLENKTIFSTDASSTTDTVIPQTTAKSSNNAPSSDDKIEAEEDNNRKIKNPSESPSQDYQGEQQQITEEKLSNFSIANNSVHTQNLTTTSFSSKTELQELKVVLSEKSPESTEQGKWHEEKQATEKEVVIEDNTLENKTIFSTDASSTTDTVIPQTTAKSRNNAPSSDDKIEAEEDNNRKIKNPSESPSQDYQGEQQQITEEKLNNFSIANNLIQTQNLTPTSSLSITELQKLTVAQDKKHSDTTCNYYDNPFFLAICLQEDSETLTSKMPILKTSRPEEVKKQNDIISAANNIFYDVMEAMGPNAKHIIFAIIGPFSLLVGASYGLDWFIKTLRNARKNHSLFVNNLGQYKTYILYGAYFLGASPLCFYMSKYGYSWYINPNLDSSIDSLSKKQNTTQPLQKSNETKASPDTKDNLEDERAATNAGGTLISHSIYRVILELMPSLVIENPIALAEDSLPNLFSAYLQVHLIDEAKSKDSREGKTAPLLEQRKIVNDKAKPHSLPLVAPWPLENLDGHIGLLAVSLYSLSQGFQGIKKGTKNVFNWLFISPAPAVYLLEKHLSKIQTLPSSTYTETQAYRFKMHLRKMENDLRQLQLNARKVNNEQNQYLNVNHYLWSIGNFYEDIEEQERKDNPNWDEIRFDIAELQRELIQDKHQRKLASYQYHLIKMEKELKQYIGISTSYDMTSHCILRKIKETNDIVNNLFNAIKPSAVSASTLRALGLVISAIQRQIISEFFYFSFLLRFWPEEYSHCPADTTSSTNQPHRSASFPMSDTLQDPYLDKDNRCERWLSQQMFTKHIQIQNEKFYIEEQSVEGDGWCALRAAGFNAPEKAIKALFSQLHRNKVKMYLRLAIESNCQSNQELDSSSNYESFAIEGLDSAGHSIQQTINRLYKVCQTTHVEDIFAIDRAKKDFDSYLEQPEVQTAYLNYVLKDKYANYQVVAACLVLQGKRLGLFLDNGETTTGELTNLTEDGVDICDENTICLTFNRGRNERCAHYNRVILHQLPSSSINLRQEPTSTAEPSIAAHVMQFSSILSKQEKRNKFPLHCNPQNSHHQPLFQPQDSHHINFPRIGHF